MKRKINTLILFLIVLCPFSLINAETSVKIRIVNLPTGFEGQSIALTGSLNNWNNSSNAATVTNNELNYYLDDVELTPLTDDWIDRPENANAGFRFVKSGTWESMIRAYFQTNDCNFRLTLTSDIENDIVIDALGEDMPIVDQEKDLTINGVKADNTPKNTIDISKFSFPNGKWKALIMSYDDNGYQDRDLVKIFNKYNIVGSFNINTGFLGNSDKITADEVKTLYADHEVAIHTVSHPYLEKESDDDLYHQIADCQKTLEELVGYSVIGIAYPFGTYDERTLKLLEDLGVIYGRTTVNTFSFQIAKDLPHDLLRWNPTCHDSSADYFGGKLIDWDKEEMALLHIWGHSWEHTDNWTSLENFCKKIGNRDDIWYAQAKDVAAYLIAVGNVEEFGTDSLYNPSEETSVWLKTDDGIKEIKPGQTYIYSGINGIKKNKSEISEISLYPNPVDTDFSAAYCLKQPSQVRISLYDLSGKTVLNILNNKQDAGQHTLTYDISDLQEGKYLLVVNSDKNNRTGRMLIKK